MKKINETLVKKLAYEERLCLYRLAQKKELSDEEIEGVLHLTEKLTHVNLESVNFDYNSMSVLGIDNCCNYFKTLCQQYSDLITKGEDGDYIAHQKRMDVAIGSQYEGIKPRIMDIGLYDAAKQIDEIEEYNCIELFNGSMKGQKLSDVNKYAMINTFATMYYSIRDFIEGKSYYDGQFMTEHRELPESYMKQSESLINAFMHRSKVTTPELAKSQLVGTLNEGVNELKNIITTKNIQKDYYEQLKEDFYKEHGYPKQEEKKEVKDITSKEYVQELKEAYDMQHGTTLSSETSMHK